VPEKTGVCHNVLSCLLQFHTSETQANQEAEAAASACAELFLQLSEMLDRCQQIVEELTAAGDLLGQARTSMNAEQADEDTISGQVGLTFWDVQAMGASALCWHPAEFVLMPPSSFEWQA
jgi:hypothetical protein